MENETVSARIFRYVRRKWKLSQIAMADQLAVNQSTISKIEKGLHQPKMRLITRLERYTQKSFNELKILSKEEEIRNYI
jgi:DNA-binding XRE family transcriptional regulator